MGHFLGICIPTYNRAGILDRSLGYLVKRVSRYDIGIYVSDNASTDGTDEVGERYQAEYSNVYYSRNSANMGPDKNFELALKMSNECKYSWLLGDDDFILFEKMDLLIEKLMDQTPDVLVVNTKNQVKDKLPATYVNSKKMLVDLGWHMTFMSSLILSQRCVMNADYDRYSDTGFIHFGSVFDYLSRLESMSVLWVDDVCVVTLRESFELPSWYRTILKVFAENWLNAVFILPHYYDTTSKIHAARSLWKKSATVSIKGLVILRVFGLLERKTLQQYREQLYILIGAKYLVAYMIASVPKSLISWPAKLLLERYFRKRMKESSLLEQKLFGDQRGGL